MKKKEKKKGRKWWFELYDATELLPCLRSRQPSLNSTDIDWLCSSNNKARDVAPWREQQASFSTRWGCWPPSWTERPRLDLLFRAREIKYRSQLEFNGRGTVPWWYRYQLFSLPWNFSDPRNLQFIFPRFRFLQTLRIHFLKQNQDFLYRFIFSWKGLCSIDEHSAGYSGESGIKWIFTADCALSSQPT